MSWKSRLYMFAVVRFELKKWSSEGSQVVKKELASSTEMLRILYPKKTEWKKAQRWTDGPIEVVEVILIESLVKLLSLEMEIFLQENCVELYRMLNHMVL